MKNPIHLLTMAPNHMMPSTQSLDLKLRLIPLSGGGCISNLWRKALCLLAIIMAGPTFAADVNADFGAANKLYAQGKFAEAAGIYGKILQSGTQSSAVLFNYANAEFKSGHLGKAIAAYQQAGQLSPRDAELRANLAFVRNQVQGVSRHESIWQNWFNSLTLNEGTLLTAFLLWVTLGLLALRQLRPAWVPKLRGPTRFLVVLTILSGSVLALQATSHFQSWVAVVITAEATARSGPFDDAQSSFTVHDGAELSVLDRRDGWVQISNGTGKSGWLPVKQVELVPGA